MRGWISIAPLVLLIAGALFANIGGAASPAKAASNIVVDATVASVVTLTPCATPLAISVGMNTLTPGVCSTTFGASNNGALPLTINDSNAVPFLSGAAFPNDAVAGCGAMTGDSVGVKVGSVGLTAAENHACVASVAATNTDFEPMPTAATTICTTTIVGNQVCPIVIGIIETGSNATAGTYSGTMVLTA